jgi:DNA-binding NarL/FixJ family response regulator
LATEVEDATTLGEVAARVSSRIQSELILVAVQGSLTSFTEVKSACEDLGASRFAVLSASCARQDVLCALAVGFHGFISKAQPDYEILDAIKDLLSGRIYLPPRTIATNDPEPSFRTPPLQDPARPSEADSHALTKRQREVLLFLTQGMSNKQIAGALHISEATVKIHAAALCSALGVRNRTEAAFKAATLANNCLPPVLYAPRTHPDPEEGGNEYEAHARSERQQPPPAITSAKPTR